MKKTLFLVFSSCIVVFSIISICTAPIIKGILGDEWGTANCKLLADIYENNKSEDNKISKNYCYRHKAMYGLEYSSLILDIVLGFVCAVLGLLHYFDVGKPFEKITGIIGLSTGAITFILTLVYICYSGYIFTKDIYSTDLVKLNKDSAFAEKDGNKYKCLYYKDNDKMSIYAKYNDLGKKQYNYDKDRYFDSNTACDKDEDTWEKCATQEYLDDALIPNCDYLRSDNKPDKVENKYLFDMWVTTIIFTVLICACAIGLAIFGFLLFKNSDGSGL